jgi:hypothetical protein
VNATRSTPSAVSTPDSVIWIRRWPAALEHIGDNLILARRPDDAYAAFERAIPLFEQV